MRLPVVQHFRRQGAQHELGAVTKGHRAFCPRVGPGHFVHDHKARVGEHSAGIEQRGTGCLHPLRRPPARRVKLGLQRPQGAPNRSVVRNHDVVRVKARKRSVSVCFPLLARPSSGTAVPRHANSGLMLGEERFERTQLLCWPLGIRERHVVIHEHYVVVLPALPFFLHQRCKSKRGVFMEAKPFSIGFRIEHPQGMIDQARWGRHAGHPLLSAAEYKLVHHASNGRSVYSFCMCPGGTVVAATSEPGRVVTNGMSQYSRNERNANAGIVVGIEPGDFPTDRQAFEATLGIDPGAHRGPLVEGRVSTHPLAGIVLQRQLESHAYVLGGSNYQAPGQLVGDVVAGRASSQLGSVAPSYQPGVLLGSLSTALPDYAIAAIREAIPAFGKKIKGFDRHDAVFTGVETRTSSPLRITRGDDLQSLNVEGLYPAGEGASYAGGILSAGVDGIRVAEAIAHSLRPG